jgi:hypothetical protein
MKPGLPPKASASPIYAILGEMKGAVFLLFAVGFFVNLLQLTGSVYMMQVYERSNPACVDADFAFLDRNLWRLGGLPQLCAHWSWAAA